MLLDKGYYDYDFEKLETEPEQLTMEDTVRSDEEIANRLVGFGFTHLAPKKPETKEEIQEYILKQIKED